MRKVRNWTTREIEILKMVYEDPDITIEEMMQELHRTKRAIMCKANEIGLWRYSAYILHLIQLETEENESKTGENAPKRLS